MGLQRCSHGEKQHIKLYTFYKRTPAAVTLTTKSNIPGTSINNALWVIAPPFGGLHQQDPWFHWQCGAGSQAASIPISFHMIILNFTADDFLLRQTAAAKCQSTDENAPRWGRKLKGSKGGGVRGLVTPLHHRCLGYAPLWMWPAVGWWGMKGAAVDTGLGAPVCLYVDLTASRSFSVPKGSMYVAFFEQQKAATFTFSSLKLKWRDIDAFLTQKWEFICYYLLIYYLNKSHRRHNCYY